MRLTQRADYALRVLVRVGLAGGSPVGIAEIARDYGISRAHLTKVVWELARGGFLSTGRGRGGGARLARPAGEIVLGDVLRLMEGPPEPVECFRDDGACRIAPACAARAMFREAADAFLAVFDRHTLADILVRGPQLGRLLGFTIPPGAQHT